MQQPDSHLTAWNPRNNDLTAETELNATQQEVKGVRFYSRMEDQNFERFE